MNQEQKQGKIYCIRSLLTDKCYIGSTTSSINRRHSKHKSNLKNYYEGKYCYVTSFEVLSYGDSYITILETVYYDTNDQLHARERYWIENTENTVNDRIPGAYAAAGGKAAYDAERNRLTTNCPCGGRYKASNKFNHLRTQKHQRYIASLEANQANNI